MAALTYTVSTTEAKYIKTKAVLLASYSAVCIKTLTVAIDPLVDPTIVEPNKAYYFV
jgi:hypothetical protein